MLHKRVFFLQNFAFFVFLGDHGTCELWDGEEAGGGTTSVSPCSSVHVSPYPPVRLSRSPALFPHDEARSAGNKKPNRKREREIEREREMEEKRAPVSRDLPRHPLSLFILLPARCQLSARLASSGAIENERKRSPSARCVRRRHLANNERPPPLSTPPPPSLHRIVRLSPRAAERRDDLCLFCV